MSKSQPAYDVGYGKPPKEHRWQKGQSGNARGRKKAKLDPPGDLQEACHRALLEKQRATRSGKEVQIPKFELLAELMVNDAIRGTSKERGYVVQLLDRIGVFDGLRLAQEEANAEPYEPLLTEADRRLLEIIEEDLFTSGEPSQDLYGPDQLVQTLD